MILGDKVIHKKARYRQKGIQTNGKVRIPYCASKESDGGSAEAWGGWFGQLGDSL